MKDAAPRASVDELFAIVDAARALVSGASSRAALVPSLVRSTGLSREGVELALTEHLELDATAEELTRLRDAVTPTSRVAVILSSNVFVGALRAVVLARAASARVMVRPSRREPEFARALVTALEARGVAGITLEEALDVARVPDGEIHLYGRDETIADVRARASVPVRGHGAGLGIAVVGPGAPAEVSAAALARDIVAFDQRGCLSPRVAFVVGERHAADVARALHAELSRLEAVVPRGALTAAERADIVRYVETMSCAGEVSLGPTHALGLARAAEPFMTLPPPGRVLHIAAVDRFEDVPLHARPLTRALTTIGAAPSELGRVTEIARELGARARIAELGAMQRPRLDGPVDLRGDDALRDI